MNIKIFFKFILKNLIKRCQNILNVLFNDKVRYFIVFIDLLINWYNKLISFNTHNKNYTFLIAKLLFFFQLMIISKQVISVFLFSVAKNSVNLSKNYYKILEVDTACDQKIIKKSYLKLVKALHPDVNPNGK